MKKFLLILTCALVYHCTFSQQKDNRQLTIEVDKILSAFKVNQPGATVLIARDGQILYKKALGMANIELAVPMQADHVFRIGSVTKQFTAIAILQLMEQGKLNLQDDITRFIPDYPVQGNKITIEHLLTHTSGIRDHTSIPDTIQRSKLDFTPKEMIDYFKDQPIRFAPGRRYEYSNSNYTLLGYIIEKITGKGYAQYLEENFFKPLGMSNSFYASETKIIKNRADGYSKNGEDFTNAAYISMTQPYAAGSILSTVGDLFKWQQAVQSFKLVKKETLDKAWTRYQLNDGNKSNYGYGWRQGYIQESPTQWHGGLVNGFKSMIMYLPKENAFVAVLSNCESYPIEDVTAKLAALAIGNRYQYKEMAVNTTVLREYTGVYENEKGQQRIISVAGNALYAQLNRSPKSQIKAYKKDWFFFDADPMQSIEFTRNNKGEVEKLITKSRVAIEVWNKTNKPVPAEDGIKVDEKILETYTGVYEISPEFTFTVTNEGQKLFLQATGQEKLELFAETETKFFLKVNDALLEFVKDNAGKVTKISLMQGNRKTDAKKIK
jgi:CubicO group peptidase (beta-lactamase class C family)